MREPIRHDEPDALPAPKISLLPGPKKRKEPDAEFLAKLGVAIRAGARPRTAAAWLGVSKKTWTRWKQSHGDVFDQLRQVIRESTAHLEVRLQSEMAKKNPGLALRGLRKIRDDDPDEPSRVYNQSGLYTLKKALPTVISRISDDSITDLSPLEQVAKGWRDALIRDCGGREAMTEAQSALVTTIVGSRLLLGTVDSVVQTLAETRGVVDRGRRRVYPIVESRARLADSLVRQLQALGLERKTAPQSLSEIIEQAKATHGNGHHGNGHA